MSFLALAASAVTLGFLHGLGADHLMVIAALSVDGPRERRHVRAIRTAFGFACGHAVILGIGAVLAVTIGVLLPAAVTTGAERLGGGLLVAMGVFGLWSVTGGRTYGHIHGLPGRIGAGRWHLHLMRPSGHPAHAHGGSVVPLVLGALFAVSSLRAMMMLQPFSPDARALALPALLILIALFGVGILISMSLFGVLLARVLSLKTVTSLGRLAAGLVATASIGLGVYWITT
jgi:nickel/cobalt transporter (NicO) family protein